jgi:hypothetical protein
MLTSSAAPQQPASSMCDRIERRRSDPLPEVVRSDVEGQLTGWAGRPTSELGTTFRPLKTFVNRRCHAARLPVPVIRSPVERQYATATNVGIWRAAADQKLIVSTLPLQFEKLRHFVG